MTNKTKWSIDQVHSEIAFKIKHLMISHVKGSFKIFDASIYTAGKDFASAEIDLWIDAGSISTGDAKRDEHLTGPDFFDVQNHRQITFTSSSVAKPDKDGNSEIWGNLTLKGISKLVPLNVQFGGTVHDPWGNEKAGFTVDGKIKRSDWGLSWNTALETGGLLVSDEVTILCEIQLTNTLQQELTMVLEPAEYKEGSF